MAAVPGAPSEVGQTLLYLLDETRSLNFRVVEPFVRYRQSFYAHRTIEPEEALEVLAHLAGITGLPLSLEASPEVLRARLPEPGAFHLAALGPALTDDDLVEAALAHLEAGATGDLGLMLPGPQAGQPGCRSGSTWGGFAPWTSTRRWMGRGPAGPGPGPVLPGLPGGLFRGRPGPGAGDRISPAVSWLWDHAARRQDWQDDLGAGRSSLSEWVWATRTLPARLLGLEDRGRLSPGARADVAIYDVPTYAPPGQWHHYLGRCRTLLKAGEVVVDNFSLVNPEVPRATYYRETGAEATPMLAEICQFQSLRRENLWVREGLGGPWVGV